MVSVAMTAATRSQAMSATTVRIASGTIVRSVRHIVRYATRLCAWDVVLNVLIAENLFAGIVPQFVTNATRFCIRIDTALWRRSNSKYTHIRFR